MMRGFVNLVTQNWTEGVYSVRRIDPYRHFFYGSADAALRAAAANKNKIQDLPTPRMNFSTEATHGGTLDMFALLSPRAATGDGRIVYANTTDSSHHLGWTLSEKWSHVGEWMMPFHGRAQYVPEFNLWFGLSALSPYHHLCATDLSVMADGRQPTAPTVWKDLNPPAEGEGEGEGEAWLPKQLELIHLGGGKFLIAKTFREGGTGGYFSVLTGVEMLLAGAGGDRQQTLQMVKHKCARFVWTDEDIEWVL